MTAFAVIKDDKVINAILAESLGVAQDITGHTCVEIPENSKCRIGSLYMNNDFTNPSPFPSWVYSQEVSDWIAPVTLPEDENIYNWSEDDLEWKIAE